MKKIILIGHSHTNCIFSELHKSYRNKYQIERIHIADILKITQDEKLDCSLGEVLVREIDKRISILSTPKKLFSLKKDKINIVLLFGGSFHNMLGLIEMNPPFDFIDVEDKTVNENVELVPLNAIKLMFRQDIDPNESLVSVIREKYQYNIFHLGFPPPLQDAKTIMENIETYFTIRYKNPVLASSSLRSKLWRVYLSMYCEMYEKYNIPYVPVPETMIEGGFLCKDAFADATHANDLYAKAYIELFGKKLV